ncbi:MAG: EAL domain-containing protein [Sulfuricurvum sp.]|jgi:diguanylate cyclase (GGDEF)-like protein/PAS domain S-box-containing protein|uniref:sensor domain-containing phosphodiesterase n=1 Tax=Sulfuricurvum sp. TaxID=2025608 RepID=UPI0025E1C66C|nr:EAL domain-containing protein [Sulfuricurvum sp.]MCK9373638.1 EAL domain-containing protein [Sulfuricurvum sp.]
MDMSNSRLPQFYRSLWQTVALFTVFSVTFFLYVQSEKKIDDANELRLQSHMLINELRQSSDDLTRMARSYVITKNPLYKRHFEEILAIRNGTAPRPVNYYKVYWDLIGPNDRRPRPYSSKSIPLLELIRQSGFTAAEYAKLSESKRSSDALADIESRAISLCASDRELAIRLLYNASFHHAKAAIMQPISDVHDMMDKRTLENVHCAENTATGMRIVFIFFGMFLLLLFWRTYRALHLTLGGSLNQLYTQISLIGSGNFSSTISVAEGMGNSILGWLSATQIKLSLLDAKRKEAEKNNLHTGQLYAALSQCNEAIIRSRNAAELFPKICENAVTHSNMKLVWIGIIDEQTQRLNPVAYYGQGSDYIKYLHISIDSDHPNGNGPSGIVCREDHPFWCQNFQSNPLTKPWHERSIEYGLKASAALPLHKNGRIIGTFNLYAAEEDAFDELTRNLLLEMTADIDHALTVYAHEEARKNAEEGLKNSYNLLMSIINTAPVRIFWKDTHLNYLGCNQIFAKDAGEAAPQNIIGKNDTQLVWKGQAELYQADDRRILESGHPKLFFEEPQTTPDGQTIWLRTSKVPFRNEANEIIGILGVYEDITAHKEAEKQLFKLSQAIEQSSNTIIITDYKATIEYVNAAFVQTTGYTQAEVIGKNPRFLQSGNTPYGAYDTMWAQITCGNRWHGEFQNRRKDGTEYSYSINISPVFDDDHQITHYIAIEEDISEKKESEKNIHYLANFDPLTGLPNRRQLSEHFQFTLKSAKRHQNNFALIFLDLDHFKEINDSLGHSYGDVLLIELAKRIRSMLREEDTLSRLGGDEFILLLPDTHADGAANVAQKLLECISRPFHIEQHELTVTGSLGIALYPTDGTDMEILSKNADTAMYRAKEEGRNTYSFFTKEMQTVSTRNLQLSNALYHALERNELYLVYQPQISLHTGHIVGAEALLRWEHPEFGVISPAEFIPIAENNGLILPIGEWVMRTAVHQLKEWINSAIPPLIMAVNLSAVQFRHTNLPNLVTRILDEAGLPPEYLELELTEGVAMHNPQAAINTMTNLHGRGIRMSIDDFGTGYSSLSYLKQFKIYKLKIDQSFVRDISIDSEDKAIVDAIIHMAHSLGLQTIAEGVETAEQLRYLRDQGCDEVQGYYYSKPLRAEEFETMYRNEEYLDANVWIPSI